MTYMNEKKIFILIFIFFTNYVSSQKEIYIDEQGDTIPNSKIAEKKKSLGKSITSWRYIGKDGNEYVKLGNNRYLKGIFDYDIIKKELEGITNSKISDSSTIIIEYFFKGDLCTNTSKDDIWTKREINKRKNFIKPIKKELLSKGIFFVCLFELGIELKNKEEKPNEYFFTDKKGFFKENIFLNQSTCGSYAAIKPNGETLIRNGEYRADWFANHLTEENWSLFFKPSEDNAKEEKTP